MRSLSTILVITATISMLISCGGKDKKSSPGTTIDSVASVNPATPTAVNDSTLGAAKTSFENELAVWAKSFNDFHTDSLRMTHKTDFEQVEDNEETDMNKFYELYKPALSFTPDSSQFIDLYSSGVTLEKRGKKIIAIADVDQAVILCNTKTREWKRIAFFGPSAAIEEAVWTSPSSFILAGTMHNDDGQRIAILMLGDTESKTFRWFEAVNTKRPESSNYEASGMKKLKIDEWE